MKSPVKNEIEFQVTKPAASLSYFVESFWFLHNTTGSDKEIIILPDGRADLTFSQSSTESFHITRSGIETYPDTAILKANTRMFAISFKLPAIEYIFQSKVSGILNYAEYMPAGFWGFNAADLTDFDAFCKKASQKITSLLPKEMDERKKKLFELMYASKGAFTVKDLSEKTGWSSRQINRYFNEQFGISLKTYCNILRFRASLDHIAQGKLFPELNFTDQAHFIKQVKKFAGVVPKELSKNKNDRFVLLSALKQK